MLSLCDAALLDLHVRLRALERVRFRVEDPVVEADKVWRREDEIEVL